MRAQWSFFYCTFQKLEILSATLCQVRAMRSHNEICFGIDLGDPSVRREEFMTRTLPNIAVPSVNFFIVAMDPILLILITIAQSRCFGVPTSFDFVAPTRHQDLIEVQTD